MVEMVSNTQGSHLEEIKMLFQLKAKRVIIASPYLAQNIKELLDEFNFENIESIELITTFKPQDQEQLTKPFLLKNFFEYFQKKHRDMQIKIHIDNSLHGKLYISSLDQKHTSILGSANFTKNGLIGNHEWGVKIEDNEIISNIIEDLYDCIEFREVTYNQIKKACLFAEVEAKNHPEWQEKSNISIDILKKIYSIKNSSNREPQYFLKPIGTKDSPITIANQQNFSALVQDLYFSKKKPKSVGKGDIVITYGVGSLALLSYFKVTGGLEAVTKEEVSKEPWKERWPWYMEGRNQAESFANEWWQHNIRYDEALKEFSKNFPNEPVTTAGGKSLGTFNFGADKAQITKKFGDFLIGKINSASI